MQYKIMSLWRLSSMLLLLLSTIGLDVVSTVDNENYDCKADEYYFPIHEFNPMEVTENVTFEQFVKNLAEVKAIVYGNMTSLPDGEIAPPPDSTFEIHEHFRYLELVTRVGVHVYPGRIVKIDVEQQTLTLIVHEAFAWKDERLQWPKTREVTVEEVLLNSSDVWTPSIYASHIIDEVELINSGMVNVYYDGVSILRRSMEYTIPCLIDGQNFPFDKHTCTFSYTQPRTTHYRLWLSFVAERVDTARVDSYSTPKEYAHLEWSVRDNSLSLQGDKCTHIQFSITLQRQASFYAIVLIFPTVLLNLLSLVVFTLPIDTTERENFSLTLMLTYFVLFMIIVDSIPPTGNQVPIFGLYVILCTSIVVLTFGMSMVLISLHKHKTAKQRKMSGKLFWFLQKCCRFEKYFSRQYKVSLKKTSGNNNPTGFESESDGFTSEKTSNHKVKESAKWKLMAIALNRVFFVTTVILHLILLILLLIYFI